MDGVRSSWQRNAAQSCVLRAFLSPRGAQAVELGLNQDLTEAERHRGWRVTRESLTHPGVHGEGRPRLELQPCRPERGGQEAWILLQLSHSSWVTLGRVLGLSAS